jgi:coenzyme F420-0:L-glutamate ligase/coenzyme F420-1:gamma-L-glutamate ligase
MTRFEVLAVTGIGDIRPGDDLAAVITSAAPWLTDGDILIVTSKIVSKAEGRLVDLPPGEPEREAARERILQAETARPVASRGPVRIVQTHHGLVMAAAGIDASNVDSAHLVLLPKDPDGSARALRAALRERFRLDVAVVITDTMGRPWRLGLTDTAVGAAGIDALTDYRGTLDPYGNALNVTQMAVVDELAAAGELVKGKTDQVPVAVVRGIPVRADGADGDGAAVLVRRADEDLFSLGTGEARALGLHDAAELEDAKSFTAGEVRVDWSPYPEVPRDDESLPPNTGRALGLYAERSDPASIAKAGAEIHRLRIRLAAKGYATAWLDQLPAPGIPAGAQPLGVLAIGLPA